MSTMLPRGRKTKGKQKIKMKKVETYSDRMITFSKRKSGIYKKMSEIITMYDVEAAFLVFSEIGKPYTFRHPSMEKIAERLKNPHMRYENSSQNGNHINIDVLVEAYKRKKINELMKKFLDLLEKFETEQEKAKMLKKSRDEKDLEKLWWNSPLEGLGEENLERRHKMFMDLHDKLCDMVISRLGKEDGGSSSGGARYGN